MNNDAISTWTSCHLYFLITGINQLNPNSFDDVNPVFLISNVSIKFLQIILLQYFSFLPLD